ncbi:MAG: sugar phosphate isomerase/epimerase [Spirochaetales bacterium]|jgi:sugar phosphate isomerase/epimerase|nr:sugar phosphate isomerase/epimerase [Spirochaetales bacterium]
MKLSIAIADSGALPSAFVVFRGFEASMKAASELGYNGIELALKRPEEVQPEKMDALLAQYNLEVSAISTGQVYADLGLSFSDPPSAKKEGLVKMFHDFIDLASVYGGKVNIGRVRGNKGTLNPDEPVARFVETVRDLSAYAKPKGVTLLMEPVNRYELDFINSVEEGARIVEQIGADNIKLMPDVFHMNIEDVTIGGELEKWIDKIGYIHLADSNRLAPGQGHTDFDDIFRHLEKAGYSGWVSVEILPKPEPYTAAKQAAAFLEKYLRTE